MRGRRKKSDTLKLLEGNPGKRPIKKTNIKISSKPRKPFWLSERAKTEWNRLLPILKKEGLFTNLDRTILALYCQTYSDWVELIIEMQKVKKEKGEKSQKRYKELFKMSLKLLRELKSLCLELGFSPSSRARLDLPILESQYNNMDPNEIELEKMILGQY